MTTHAAFGAWLGMIFSGLIRKVAWLIKWWWWFLVDCPICRPWYGRLDSQSRGIVWNRWIDAEPFL